MEVEFACNEVGNGDEVPRVSIACLCDGGLDQAVHTLDESIVDLGMPPECLCCGNGACL